jgi:hypothetical protein
MRTLKFYVSSALRDRVYYNLQAWKFLALGSTCGCLDYQWFSLIGILLGSFLFFSQVVELDRGIVRLKLGDQKDQELTL